MLWENWVNTSNFFSKDDSTKIFILFVCVWNIQITLFKFVQNALIHIFVKSGPSVHPIKNLSIMVQLSKLEYNSSGLFKDMGSTKKIWTTFLGHQFIMASWKELWERKQPFGLPNSHSSLFTFCRTYIISTYLTWFSFSFFIAYNLKKSVKREWKWEHKLVF